MRWKVVILVVLVLFKLCLAQSLLANETFRDGETLKYVVKWTGIPAGVVTMKALKSKKDPKLMSLVLTAKTNTMISWFHKVGYSFHSEVEVSPFRSLSFKKDLKQKKRHIIEKVTFDYEKGALDYSKQNIATGEKPRNNRIVFDEIALTDPLSMFYYIRSMDFRSGKSDGKVKVFSDGKIFDLGFEVIARHRINTPIFGSREAIHLRPTAKYEGVFTTKGSLDMWLDLKSGIPLRLKFSVPVGWATIELISSNHPKLKSKSFKSRRRR